MKIAVTSFKFHWSPIEIQGTTSSDNGLVPNDQQGITSTCDGLIDLLMHIILIYAMQYLLSPGCYITISI